MCDQDVERWRVTRDGGELDGAVMGEDLSPNTSTRCDIGHSHRDTLCAGVYHSIGD